MINILFMLHGVFHARIQKTSVIHRVLRLLCIGLLWMAWPLCAPAPSGTSGTARKSRPFGAQHSRYAALRGKVNWRSGPGPDHDICWCYESPGWPVVVVKKYENWYQIKDFLGTSGWVKVSMLSFKPTLLVLDDTILYGRPQSNSRKKAKLQKGAIVRYIKSKDNMWLYVMTKEHKISGWILVHTVWPNPTAL